MKVGNNLKINVLKTSCDELSHKINILMDQLESLATKHNERDEFWKERIISEKQRLEDDFKTIHTLLFENSVNQNHGSRETNQEFRETIKQFLNTAVTIEDIREYFSSNLDFKAPAITFKRRNFIALALLYNILHKSKSDWPSMGSTIYESNMNNNNQTVTSSTRIVNIKDVFYKPVAYFAYTLKLYYDLDDNVIHPKEIYAEIAKDCNKDHKKAVIFLSKVLEFLESHEEYINLDANTSLYKNLYDIMQYLITPMFGYINVILHESTLDQFSHLPLKLLQGWENALKLTSHSTPLQQGRFYTDENAIRGPYFFNSNANTLKRYRSSGPTYLMDDATEYKKHKKLLTPPWSQITQEDKDEDPFGLRNVRL